MNWKIMNSNLNIILLHFFNKIISVFYNNKKYNLSTLHVIKLYVILNQLSTFAAKQSQDFGFKLVSDLKLDLHDSGTIKPNLL